MYGEKVKILLMNPPGFNGREFIREGRCNQEEGAWGTLWPPITLATTAAMLEEKGNEVKIFDCAAQKIRIADLMSKISERNFRLIILATATPSIDNDLFLVTEISRAVPGAKIAVIGTHVTALANDCLSRTEGLDFVIRNEPEESLGFLVNALRCGNGFKGIRGISYKDGDGKVFHNPSRPFIQDLDSFPFPAWHLLDLEKYKLPLIGEKFLILAPIRGCPYSCTFCTAQTYYGGKLRKKSALKVVDEIVYNIERFNINQFFIWADTFTADRNYVKKICEVIQERRLRIGWTCNSRVDTVDLDLLKQMARAGCWMISYGLESGNQTTLDIVKKKISLRQSRDAVNMANDAGIKVAGHFLLGLPGESEKDLDETIRFALSLDIEMAQFYCAVPYPGSSLYSLASNNGWIEGRSFKGFRQDNAVMNLPGLDSSVVNDYRRSGYLKYYLRPKMLLRIFDLMRTAGIGKTIKGGVRFIKWVGL